ncbi:hypothetical protein [Chryseobacterium indoltheticum]|uniref:hypothetical protein n=1 Tax=Chryseobacterium indoltheticum TaxID=254 RepID=UPI003F492ED5
MQNYLMTHFVNNETPKNKTAQLLVFLGFGGLLWAQNFQNKFSDFTISPSKNLEIPSDINSNTISFSSNQNFWKQKVIIGTTFFIIIVGFILFFNPNNSLIKTFHSNISSSKSVENVVTTNQTQSNTDDKLYLNENVKTAQNSVSENNKDLKSENRSITTKNLVSSKPIRQKDSAETVSHKVIVVKKSSRETPYL